MLVHGCDCSIVFKTSHFVMNVPYISETIRESVIMLYEESAIEGNGTRRAIRKSGGVTGCVVTSLTLNTASLLLGLAFGASGKLVYVSGTRNLYTYSLTLLPLEDSDCFKVIQNRGYETKVFEDCRIKSFELRIEREQSIKLKLDVCGNIPPVAYSYQDIFQKENEERFYGDTVQYWINDTEYKNIYGLTLVCKKENGTKTEVWIHRNLEQDSDIPANIDEITITAKLLRDTYEEQQYGTFSITLKNLEMVSDETEIDTASAIIGPVRYYAAGAVIAKVFERGAM